MSICIWWDDNSYCLRPKGAKSEFFSSRSFLPINFFLATTLASLKFFDNSANYHMFCSSQNEENWSFEIRNSKINLHAIKIFIFINRLKVADCMSQEALRDSHEKFVNLLSSVVNEIKVRIISPLHSCLQRKSRKKVKYWQYYT